MPTIFEITASNAAVVVVLAAAVALLERIWKHPPALHLLWVLVLLKLVTPPILVFSLPQFLEISYRFRSEDPAKDQAKSMAIGCSVPATPLPLAPTSEASSGKSPERKAVLDLDWQAALGWIWLWGIVAFSAIYGCRIHRFRRLLKTSCDPSASLREMAETIGRRLGLRRMPEIRMTEHRISPMVWCLGGKPRVYLPSALFENLDEEGRAAILGHELAHVRRGDHRIRLLELAITTLFWWHPVVWWSRRRLRELEEMCCDALAVDFCSSGIRSYANALLDAMCFLSELRAVAPVGATATRSYVSLTRRISMLKRNNFVFRLSFGRLAVIGLIAAIPMAAAFAVDAPKKPAKKPAEQGNAGVQGPMGGMGGGPIPENFVPEKKSSDWTDDSKSNIHITGDWENHDKLMIYINHDEKVRYIIRRKNEGGLDVEITKKVAGKDEREFFMVKDGDELQEKIPDKVYYYYTKDLAKQDDPAGFCPRIEILRERFCLELNHLNLIERMLPKERKAVQDELDLFKKEIAKIESKLKESPANSKEESKP